MKSLLNAIVHNDRSAVVRDIHDFAAQGKNLETLFEEIISWLRGILLCRIIGDPASVLEETPEKIAAFQEIASTVAPASVQRLLESISASGYLLRDAINKQVFLESILLKAMRIAHAPQIGDLIARLNQIRSTGELAPLESVVPLYELPAGQAFTTPGSQFAIPSIPAVPVNEIGKPAVQPQPAAPAAEKKTPDAAPAPVTTSPQVEAKQEPEPVAEPEPQVEVVEAAEPVVEPVAEPAPEPVEAAQPQAEAKQEPEPLPPAEPEPQVEVFTAPEPVIERPPEEEAAVRKPARRKAAPAAEAKPAESEQDETVLPAPVIWEKLILDVREKLCKKLLAQTMLAAKVVSFDGTRLEIAFDSRYETVEALSVSREKPLLDMRLAAIAENPRAYLSVERHPGLVTPAQRRQMEDAEALRAQTARDPFVSEIIQTFDGVLTDVHHLDKQGDEEETTS